MTRTPLLSLIARPIAALTLVATTACSGGAADVPVSEEAVEAIDAPVLFQRRCAQCHGARGVGDGPSAVAYPRVGDLTDPAMHARLSDEDLRRAMRQGVGRMPPVGSLSATEREALVRYVRTLAP